MIELGPYRLTSKIGKGGVGTVWAAETGSHRASVALKVLPLREGANVDDFHRAFKNEVQAAASLDHPNVVAIYDFGYGDPDTEATTEGAVPDKSTWLVMERVHGRSLYGYRARLTWRQFRRILMDVLDALSHAHARQVIHRDIKPSNVLVTPDGMSTKLTDFGLAAFLLDRHIPHASRATGTPSYMSPEQIMGQWHRQGPWTDLYGLGCLVYTMVHGDPMFRSLPSIDAMHRHLLGDLPPFEPKMELPPAFEAWVKSLLHTSPGDRPRTAADAAFGLRLVDEVGAGDLPSPKPAPMPREWRNRAPASPLHLGASGLALFGFRTFRMVGRDDVCDRLWALLREVWLVRSRRIALLRGGGGEGKTRLLEWLAERAMETGAAHVWRAPASPESVLHAVATMVQHTLQTDGIPPEGLRQQIEERVHPIVLPDSLIDALVILSTRPNDVVDPAHVLAELFQRLAWDRPVLLCVDDVHESPPLLDLVSRLHLTSDLGGVLVVAAARDQELDASWTEMADPIIDLGPMLREDALALLSHSLDLEPKLAGEVMRRVEGNPSLAVELVGAWLQEGTIVAGPNGLELPPGKVLRPPHDLHQLWRARVDQVLEQIHFEDQRGLALAAVLGVHVEGLEWTRAAAVAGLKASWDAVDALFARLARVERRRGQPVRWSFSHVLVREALLDWAREAGDWELMNGACAAILLPESLRAAHHWLDAGQPARTIDALVEALRQAAEQELVNQAEGIADLLERALRELDVDLRDEHWHELHMARSRLEERRGDFDQAELFAHRALDGVHPDSRPAMMSNRALGRLERRAGRFAPALLHFERVINWASENDEPALEALTRRDLAFLYIRTARFAEAEGELKVAIELFARTEATLGAAGAIGMLGLIEKQRGNLEAAAHAVRRAIELGGSSVAFMATCKNNLAELERLRGNLDRAETLLNEAAALNRAAGDEDWRTQLNLGLVMLARGRAQDAREAIERALRRRSDDRCAQLGHAALAVCAARLHDWSGYDDHLTESETLSKARFRVDLDLATLLEEAGRTALKKAQAERGERALRMAEQQWQHLGRPPVVEEQAATNEGA